MEFAGLIVSNASRKKQDRLHDIADARIEIGDAVTRPFESASCFPLFSLRWLVAGAIVMLAAGLISGVGLIRYFRSLLLLRQ